MCRLPRVVMISLAFMSFFAMACQVEPGEAYRELVCETESCFICDQGVCQVYYCAEDHQCPVGRFCDSEGLCIEAIASESELGWEGQCAAHSDCGPGAICLESGRCIQSPASPDPSTSEPASSTQTDEEAKGQPSATISPIETPASEGTSEVDSSEGSAEKGTSDRAAEPQVEAPGGAEGASVPLPDHPADLCVVNDDCGFTGICLDGGCYFGCDALGACPPNQRCEAGQCLPTDTPEVACTFNGECGPERVCIEGQCFTTCGESLDCGEQMTCSAGLCLADTAPVIQCSGSGACETGEGCFDGKCLAVCDEENPCSAEALCQFGYCHQKITCSLSNQCATGQQCLDGDCH